MDFLFSMKFCAPVYHIGILLLIGPVALLFGRPKLGLGQLVQLLSHGIGGDIEFFGQFPQVGADPGIKKEAGQEFDPGF